MSSTNRGGQRSPADVYPTPAWCVHRLLEAVDLPGGDWLEPCAGDGAIIRAVQAVRQDVRWQARELRASCAPLLTPLARTSIGSVLDWEPPRRPAVLITNPPFRIAMDIVNWSMARADTVVMLLRLNFVASVRRAPFMRAHPPDVYVLPNRPSFTGGGTDSVEYAWFVWPQEEGPRRAGRLQVLPLTPRALRGRSSRP